MADKYNPEGYRDPTAYDALRNIDEEERVTAIISIIRQILKLAGFELTHRIGIRSTRTGREYR